MQVITIYILKFNILNDFPRIDKIRQFNSKHVNDVIYN